MKHALLAVALAVATALASAQDAADKSTLKKKSAAKKQQPSAVKKAHSKPSPEQIRKFNELQKKQ